MANGRCNPLRTIQNPIVSLTKGLSYFHQALATAFLYFASAAALVAAATCALLAGAVNAVVLFTIFGGVPSNLPFW